MRIKINGFDYPQFVFGADEDGGEFLVHLAVPRFVCKVGVAPEDEGKKPKPGKGKQDKKSKALPEVHVTEEGETLSEFVWQDKAPDAEAFTALMVEVEEFLDRYMVALAAEDIEE